MRRLALLLVLVFGAATSPAVAAPASPSVREALPRDVQSQFDDAARLYKESRYTEARDLFLTAYAQSGEPRVLFNVAVCDKALGRYARAITTLERSLVATDRPLPKDYIEKVAEAIKTLSHFVAFVEVDASVEGATVTVDGELVKGNPTALETGEHTFVARAAGYTSASTKVAVKAGESRRVQLTLEPEAQSGSATVSCAIAARCEVRVGDESLGLAPLTFTRSAGSYLVRAFVDGREWSQQRVAIENGRTLAITLGGRPVPSTRLRVNTGGSDDTIEVDGAPAGRAGKEIPLAPGEHHVVIKRKDGAVRALDLVLRDDETRDLRVMFEEKKGISPWWFVGGGVIVAGAIAAAAVIALQPTRFEGNTAGTLNPFVVPASFGGSER